MSEDKFARTREILQSKWLLPVGEEKEIRVEFGDDVLHFKARVLSASEFNVLRNSSVRPDGSVDPALAEEANNEFIRKAIIEPELDPEKLHPILKDVLLDELMRIHGYSEDILVELEKKLRQRGSGSTSPSSSKSRK